MSALIVGLSGGMELAILLVVALLLFGGQRVAGMDKGAGRAIREFKEKINAPTGGEASNPTEAEKDFMSAGAEIASEPRKGL